MGFLTDIPTGYVSYKGRRYRINAAYDTVLVLQKLFKDKTLKDGDKVGQALRMICRNRVKVWCLSMGEKAELLDIIYKEHIDIIYKHSGGSSKKVVDFDYDGGYVYAAFLQTYGIDLIREQGRLTWRKFAILFESLPDDTKIKEVMKIRGMELPEPTKYNQKERQNIMQLKTYYALPVDGNSADALFATLERMAR